MQRSLKNRRSYSVQLTEIIKRRLQLRRFQTAASLTFKSNYHRRRLSSKSESAQSNATMVINEQSLTHVVTQHEFPDTMALTDAEILQLAVAASEQVTPQQGVKPQSVEAGKIFLTADQANKLGFDHQ